MRKRHYAAVLLSAVAALSAGAALLPGPLEVALMRLKDGDYSRALRTYEDRYRRGERNTALVAGLREIYLQHAEVEKAVALMEAYIAEHPRDVAARKLLGETYQAARLPERYTANLADIAELEPTAANFWDLAASYEKEGDFARQAEALRRLLALGNAPPGQTEEAALKLAGLQASAGRPGDAAATLRSYLRGRRASGDRRAAELLLRVMIDAGEAARIPREAAAWAGGDPEFAARIAGILVEHGQSAAALETLSAFAGKFESHTGLLLQLVEAERATGKSGQAFARLAALRDRGRLPKEALPALVDLAIETRKLDLAAAVITGPGSALPEWVIASFLDAAYTSGHRDLALTVWQKLGADFTASRPLLGAELALAKGDKATAGRLAEAALQTAYEPRDRIALASILDQAGRREKARAALEGVPFASLPEAAQVQLAWIWVDAGEVEAGRRQTGGAQGPAWAILAAAAGDPAVVAWVDKSEPGERLLLDLYFLAARRSDAALQWALARKLRARGSSEAAKIYEPALLAAAAGLAAAELEAYAAPRLADPGTPEADKERLVFALLSAKADRTALPTLERWARSRRGQWFSAFVEASVRSGNSEALVRFLAAELGRKDLSRREREDRLYVLAEHGGPARALPFTRQFAEQYGGQWAAAYESTLTALGRKDELVAWWRRKAAGTLTAAERRVLAFNLLDAGDRATAEALLMGLAADAEPDSADVRQLTALWGSNAPRHALEWIDGRMQAAAGARKVRWLEILYEAGGRKRVIDAGRRWPSPKPEPYLRALQGERDLIGLGAEIQKEAAASTDPEALRRLARLALEESLRGPASFAFERLCALRPGDLEGLSWLGRLAYADRRYGAARQYLARWAGEGGKDVEPLFVYAQAVEQESGRAAALDLYRRVAAAAAAEPVRPAAVRIAEAIALERTGRWEDARQRFAAMLAADPADWGARAEYAVLLIERRNWDEAARILSERPRDGDERKRFEILRAQLDLARGKPAPATERYRRILAEDPRDPALLTSLALAEAQSGRRRRAAQLFRQAMKEAPGGEADRIRAEVLREERDRVRVEHLRRTVGSQWSEDVLRFSGQAALGPGARIGFVAEASHAVVDSYRGATGNPQSLDAIRRRGEFYLERDLDGGSRWRGQFFLGNRAGGGAQFSRPDSRGATAVTIEVNRPFWEFMESLAQYGVRSRIQAERNLRLGPATAWLSGTVNRYGLADVPRAASTYGVSGGVAYPVFGNRTPWVVQYGFDTERGLRVASRQLPDGSVFQPLAFLNREVHAVGIGASHRLSRNWRAEGSAGAAIDRLGGRGPYVTGRIGYEPLNGLSFEAWVDRRLNQMNTASAAATQAGVSVTWRFKGR